MYNFVLGKCDCGFEGYRGDFCERKECPGNVVSCSGHGNCNPSTGVCSCEPGWTGIGCHIAKCEKDCSAHGVCEPLDEPVCNCTTGYFGAGCEHYCHNGDVMTPDADDLSTQYCKCDSCYTGIECNDECSGRGTCVNGTCDCGTTGWKGDKCERAGCPGKLGLDCSGHGSCVTESNFEIGRLNKFTNFMHMSIVKIKVRK